MNEWMYKRPAARPSVQDVPAVSIEWRWIAVCRSGGSEQWQDLSSVHTDWLFYFHNTLLFTMKLDCFVSQAEMKSFIEAECYRN